MNRAGSREQGAGSRGQGAGGRGQGAGGRGQGAGSITLALAWVVNIPRENRANIGPPVVPNIVALICKNQ